MILRSRRNTKLLLGLLLLVAAISTIAGYYWSNQEDSNTVVLADVPMLEDSHYVVIPVTINSQDYRFLIDTAATNTSIDIKLKSLLGDFIKKEESTITPAEIPVEFQIYRFPKRFEIGSWRIRGEIACLDLRKGGLPPDHNYGGIIGKNFLHGKVLQLDLENKRVRLLMWRKDASPSADDLIQKWGHSVPMIINELDHPQIYLNLTDTITELFLVDTGLAGLNYLRESTFDKIKKLEGIDYLNKEQFEALARSQGIEPAPKDLAEMVVINQMSLPGIDLADQHFTKRHRSILGIRFVRAFRMMTFDFENNILYLKARAKTPLGREKAAAHQ